MALRSRNTEGEPLQIVKFNHEDHKFEIVENNLAKILNRPETYDLPISIISFTGPTRVGKSLTLSYIIEYLKSGALERSTKPIMNFKWRYGTKRETIGMYAWSEPLILKRQNGDKIAVMLIDTQGLFDGRTSQEDEAKMFALSTMASSVQVYNVQTALRTDKLQFFRHFVEYGKRVQEQQSSTNKVPFQKVCFVVRDWNNEDEFELGSKGGMEYFSREFYEENEDRPADQADMRTAITECFQESVCSLFPHPGRKATKKDFDGNTKALEEDFFAVLKNFIVELLDPGKLAVKIHEGEKLKSYNVPQYIATLAVVLSSNSDDLGSVVKMGIMGGIIADIRTSIVGSYIEEITEFIYKTESTDKSALNEKHQSLRDNVNKEVQILVIEKMTDHEIPDIKKIESDILVDIDSAYTKTVVSLWDKVAVQKQKDREIREKNKRERESLQNRLQEMERQQEALRMAEQQKREMEEEYERQRRQMEIQEEFARLRAEKEKMEMELERQRKLEQEREEEEAAEMRCEKAQMHEESDSGFLSKLVDFGKKFLGKVTGLWGE